MSTNRAKKITLGLIPARGGSKGVPGKNIRPVMGKPLIAYAIECGLACPELDMVLVSSDSPEIAAIAKQHGALAPFLRPAELASDQSPMLPVMQHAINFCEEHYQVSVKALVLMDPTGPLRQPQDVTTVLEMLKGPETDCVVSGSPAQRSPYFNMVKEVDGYVDLVIPPDGQVARRQDAPQVYDLNTVVWAWKRSALMDEAARLPRRTRLYLVPPERAIDLDSELDFMLLETILSRRQKEDRP